MGRRLFGSRDQTLGDESARFMAGLKARSTGELVALLGGLDEFLQA